MASRKSKVFSLSLAQGALVLATVGSGMVFARELSVKDYGSLFGTLFSHMNSQHQTQPLDCHLHYIIFYLKKKKSKKDW